MNVGGDNGGPSFSRQRLVDFRGKLGGRHRFMSDVLLLIGNRSARDTWRVVSLRFCVRCIEWKPNVTPDPASKSLEVSARLPRGSIAVLAILVRFAAEM